MQPQQQVGQEQALPPNRNTTSQSQPIPSPSSTGGPTFAAKNPLQKFYNTKVKEFHQRNELARNDHNNYDFSHPIRVKSAGGVDHPMLKTVSPPLNLLTTVTPTADLPKPTPYNQSPLPRAGSNYSIDNILSSGNATNEPNLTYAGHKNVAQTALSHHGDSYESSFENVKRGSVAAAVNSQLPTLKFSSNVDASAIFQPLRYVQDNEGDVFHDLSCSNIPTTSARAGGINTGNGPIARLNTGSSNSGNILNEPLPYSIPPMHPYHQSSASDIKSSLASTSRPYDPMSTVAPAAAGVHQNTFVPIGQSHKVASSFHQMNLPTGTPFTPTPTTTNAATPSTSAIHPPVRPQGETSTTVTPTADTTTALANSEMDAAKAQLIDDQFKPLEYGFQRRIARSKYGAETKILKKYVVYVAPESIGGFELKSKREVTRFLKNHPEGRNYDLTTENFNFDNTVNFFPDDRKIGKVPRLKKNAKSELINDKSSSSIARASLGDPSRCGSNDSHSHFYDELAALNFSNNNDDVFSNRSSVTGSVNASLHSVDTTASTDLQGLVVGARKRGRPRGSTSKTPNKTKRTKTGEGEGQLDLTLSTKLERKPKKSTTKNGSPFQLKTKTKREKATSKDGVASGLANKGGRLSKQVEDDLTIAHTQQLPLCTRVSVENVVPCANAPSSKQEVCNTMSNLMEVYEFVQEFSCIFPLANRLSVVPPFADVVKNVFSNTNQLTTETTVLELVNSPFLNLCDCLLETYFNQKLVLPTICYEMKLEFDLSQKFNNINMCTIIRLFVEEYLDNIEHLKFASQLAYNRDLKSLVCGLKSSPTVLHLSPLLKSTLLLFLINLLIKSPSFLNNVEKMIENFTVTKHAKWNVDGSIRKFKKEAARIEASNKTQSQGNTEIAVAAITVDSEIKNEEGFVQTQPPDTAGMPSMPFGEEEEFLEHQLEQQAPPKFENISNDERIDEEPRINVTKLENNAGGIEIADHEDNSIAEEDDDECEEDDERNTSKRLAKNKNVATSDSTLTNITDKLLVEAIKFNSKILKVPPNEEKRAQVGKIIEEQQNLLRDCAFAFARRLKGYSLGQDRFSRYYSLPYHSSCVFVEHNARELELDNFINNQPSVINDSAPQIHSDFNKSNDVPVALELNQSVGPNYHDDQCKQEPCIVENSSLVENSNGDPAKNLAFECATVASNEPQPKIVEQLEQESNGFAPLMLIESVNDVNNLTRCLNNTGIREKSLYKSFTKNMKFMAENTFTGSKLYRDLSSPSQQCDQPFSVVKPNETLSQHYNVPVEQIVRRQYTQFLEFIVSGNVLSDQDLECVRLPSNLSGSEFVAHIKFNLVQLIHLLDQKGLIVLVKKAKTNSKEAKSRYTKSLAEFVESVDDCCGDLELVLTSLQLNVSFELAGSTVNDDNSHLVSPFVNKCCYDCHLNVNFDSLLCCMYCYITYHSYCQGVQQHPSQIDHDEWSCNHCKSLVCAEAESISFTLCRHCNTSVYQRPPQATPQCDMEADNQDDFDMDQTTCTTNTEANEDNFDVDPIRCSLCLYYCHRQCVQELDNSSTNDIYLCPFCSEACRSCKAIVESGRKRISKKLKLEICEMFAPCHTILHELFGHPCAEDFTKPVDLQEHPLYAQIIKKPIDLSQIDQNLKNLEYKDRDDFVADIRLIFENCKRYNQCDSEIYLAGRKMAYFFENRWAYLLSKRESAYVERN